MNKTEAYRRNAERVVQKRRDLGEPVGDWLLDQVLARPEKGLVYLQRLIKGMEVDDNDCWVWQGAAINGYGQIAVCIDGIARPIRTHRLSYAIFNETFPRAGEKFTKQTKVLDHMCENRLCLNPDHLQVVTAHQNIMFGKEGRGAA